MGHLLFLVLHFVFGLLTLGGSLIITIPLHIIYSVIRKPKIVIIKKDK